MGHDEERLKAEVRKWGHSFGVIIPTVVAKELKLKEHERIELKLRKVSDIEDLFGTVHFGKSAEEIKKEMKKGWKE